MTTSINKARQQARLITLVIGLVCAATISCAPKPVVPSGANRVPINSDEMISQYRERVKSDQREKQERSLLARQVDTLTQQVQELSAALTLMQLQQQELAKGTSRSGKTFTSAALTINPPSSAWNSPLTSAPVRREDVCPASSEQSLSRTETVQRAEERSTSVGPACRIGPSAGASSSPPPRMHDAQSDSWKPRVIALSEREQVELRRHSVIFRVSQRTGRSAFRPSTTLQAHLKQAMKLGHCLQVRGYTDGDKDRWIERETATQRAQKARAYLIAQGYDPNHIEITAISIGEHVADNATKQGRATNRRVEIEVKEHNPASIWPQWYG